MRAWRILKTKRIQVPLQGWPIFPTQTDYLTFKLLAVETRKILSLSSNLAVSRQPETATGWVYL